MAAPAAHAGLHSPLLLLVARAPQQRVPVLWGRGALAAGDQRGAREVWAGGGGGGGNLSDQTSFAA
jgi:hypothetical protein